MGIASGIMIGILIGVFLSFVLVSLLHEKQSAEQAMSKCPELITFHASAWKTGFLVEPITGEDIYFRLRLWHKIITSSGFTGEEIDMIGDHSVIVSFGFGYNKRITVRVMEHEK